MTLARTALRLSTIACLQGLTKTTGPTLAHNRIYDSRMSDFSPDAYPADALPSVIVLTDEDAGDALSDQNGGPPFNRMVNLVIEFAMVQGFDVPVANGGTEFMPGYPATDAEHEASLDLLEFQIKRRLAYDLAPICATWRSFVRPWKYDCHRQVLDEQGVKLAARVLTWECDISDDQIRMVHPVLNNIPGGFDLLPEPLKRVALSLTPGSVGYKACQAIAEQLTPITLIPLDGLDLQVTAVDGEDESDIMDVTLEIRSAMDMPQIVGNGAVVIDYAKGTFQNLILAGNISSITVKNWPRNGKTGRLILQTTNTGFFTANWPVGTQWSEGIVGFVTPGAGKRDIFVFTTATEGAVIFGNIVGRDYQ